MECRKRHRFRQLQRHQRQRRWSPAYYGNQANGVSYSENPDTMGGITSGGATWTVSRQYTKNGSTPATYDIELSLSVAVGAEASGYGFISAYADSRSRAYGDPARWPDLRQLDEEENADAPPGETLTDGDNTNNDSGRVYQAGASVLVSATLYVLTSAWANGGTASSGSSAQSSVSFSTP